MKLTPTVLIAFILPLMSFSQEHRFSINNTSFEIRTETVHNEWNTTDTLNTLFRLEKEGPKELLKFFTYQDRGGDCNNLFWNKESWKIKGDSLIFTTHYLQKTGIDPIPQWRKQIFVVSDSGKLTLIFDKYKFKHRDEWVEEKY